jgi:uncharacterized protein
MAQLQNGSCDCCMTHKLIKVFGLIFGIILVISATVYLVFLSRNKAKEYDYIGISEETRNVVTISGEGKIVAVPDIGKVQVGLITTKKTVAEAQKENSTKMNEIIKEIKGLGVADKDIKTVAYTIYPEYDWIDGQQIFKDYQISQTIEVKIRDTEKISAILDKAGTLGANNVGSLTFEVDNVEKIQQQARLEAITDAKTKAEELAKAMGVKLGKITAFYEDNYNPVPYYDYAVKESAGVGGMVSAAPAPSISTGESEITSNVSITFELL